MKCIQYMYNIVQLSLSLCRGYVIQVSVHLCECAPKAVPQHTCTGQKKMSGVSFSSYLPPCLGQDLYCSQLLHRACRLISIWEFACLHIPSHHRSPGIADVQYWVWLYEASGDLSSEVRSSFLYGKFLIKALSHLPRPI